MRPRRIQPVPLVWLTVIWVALQGSITWGNVLAGVALGGLVLLVFPLPRLITGATCFLQAFRASEVTRE